MVIDFARWIIFGILCLQCVGRCHLDCTNVYSYGVMYVTYCCRTKLTMFPWIYKLGENSKRNYCFHHIKWFIPLFRFKDVPKEILGFFVFVFLFFCASLSSFLSSCCAFFFCILTICWFQSRLFKGAQLERVPQLSILISFLFLGQLAFLASSLDFLEPFSNLKSYNFYGFVQRKRITISTSPLFAGCSDRCAVCLDLKFEPI